VKQLKRSAFRPDAYTPPGPGGLGRPPALAAGSSSRSRSPRPEERRELKRHPVRGLPAGSVFRIDHYLGQETVQNILALRFANEMYEPIWNRGNVDHIQISMAEDIGIGGRAG